MKEPQDKLFLSPIVLIFGQSACFRSRRHHHRRRLSHGVSREKRGKARERKGLERKKYHWVALVEPLGLFMYNVLQGRSVVLFSRMSFLRCWRHWEDIEERRK